MRLKVLRLPWQGSNTDFLGGKQNVNHRALSDIGVANSADHKPVVCIFKLNFISSLTQKPQELPS